MKRTQITSARFVVTGEAITRIARERWREGSYTGALNLLECCTGITMDQCLAILAGRARLDGQNDNVTLVADDWSPPEEYPTFADVLTAAGQMPELSSRRRADAQEIAANLARLEQRTEYWCDGADVAEMELMRPAIVRLLGCEDEADEMIAEARDALQRIERREPRLSRPIAPPERTTRPRIDPLEMVAHMARTRMMGMGMDPDSVPTVNALLHRGTKIEPELCHDMSMPNGWLLPDGKFYGCGTMEHVGLAETLLKDDPSNEPNSEKLAEKKGWVKLSKSATGFHCIGTRPPTKIQLTKLWDYADAHGRDYKELIARLPKA